MVIKTSTSKKKPNDDGSSLTQILSLSVRSGGSDMKVYDTP